MDVSQTAFSLHDAARSISRGPEDIHDCEVALAHAIEHGELHANVKRWATEQWEGRQLPGNINRLETFVEQTELATWLATR